VVGDSLFVRALFGGMSMFRCACLTLVMGLMLAPAQAEETYTIKPRKSGKGDVTRVDMHENGKAVDKLLSLDGRLLKEKSTRTAKTLQFKQTILEQPKGQERPTKIQREYKKAEVKEDDTTRPLSYQGKTILIEKKGDKYHFQIIGGAELTGDDAKDLDQEFNQGRADGHDFQKVLLPAKPMAVGATWKIDPQKVVKELSKGDKGESLVVDFTKAVASGKLISAKKKDGKQFGVIEYHLELPVKELGSKDNRLQLDPGAKLILDLKEDGCIDGSLDEVESTANLQFNYSLILKKDGMARYKAIRSVEGSRRGSRAPLPNK
jgi:hypothetical protein